MAERTQFLFTGAHMLPAVMVAMNGSAAGVAVLTYLALLALALLSALSDEKTPAQIPVRIDSEEERDIRRKR
jgi:hypothetical protein